MKKFLNINKIFVILFFSFFNFSFSQVREQKNDSTPEVYKKIEDFSGKSKSTKFLHRLIFKKKKKTVNRTNPTLKQNYSQVEGKIIRQIHIDSHDPFGYSLTDTTEVANNWFEKAGNKAHLKSKDFAIKNFLIFKKNKPLDSLLVIESERLIRDQKFIRDVKIETKAVAGSPDSVDVYITTLDSWSLVPTGSLSKSKMKLKLRDYNYLGLGHQVKVSFENRFDDGKTAYDVLYSMPNFQNTYISTAVGYTTDLDGYKRKYLDLERPFYSAYAKWAGGFYVDEQIMQKWLPDSNDDLFAQDFKYQSQDVWAGFSLQLFKGESERERTTNIITAGRLLNINYREKPAVEFDSIGYFSNETFYLGSIGISSRQFIEDTYIFRDGVTENVPIGNIFAVTAGNQYKNKRNRLYLGAKMAHGNYYKWGYFSASMEYGTFLNESKLEQTTYSFTANYFTNLIPLGSKWKMRQFIKPQILIGTNRLNSVGDRLTIDETNDFQDFYDSNNSLNTSTGIPDFDSNLLGTSKFMLSLQTQLYPPWEFIGFRFNPYFNMNMALLGDENTRIISSKIYSSFSVGVILKNDYLVFNSIQLSLTYYPSIPNEGTNIFSANALSMDDFGLQGFELGKPAPVWYN
ncbi:BamA/TamA family outer membrane protein [Bizionia myxarmorum]|uniref:Uncharacterized protein n=1 Tax=Bizionia myxarmorum TaxID=291186 RepID=A0A5D0R4P2_9FLAO|nr:hypothetical protein [Bizionia myxarmorum]TYB75831.1 hypothetical protein ES674_13485 [Bizionia myxarmorum]